MGVKAAVGATGAVTAATDDSFTGKFTQISNAELIERYNE